MSRLFQYRFPDVGGLQGHSFGNLFMAALAEVTGDFERAVQESTHVLKVRGRVLPVDARRRGAARAARGRRPGQRREHDHRRRAPAAARVAHARRRRAPCRRPSPRCARADLVVLGPGSLYTSVIPNLLIPEVRDALKETRAWVVYVCNVMTQPGETDGYTAADHLDALHRHGLAGLVDVVLVNDAPVSADLVASYQRYGARPVVVDEERLREPGVKVAHAPVAAESDVVRHDSGAPGAGAHAPR